MIFVFSFCFLLVLFQCESPSSKKSSEFLGILVTGCLNKENFIYLLGTGHVTKHKLSEDNWSPWDTQRIKGIIPTDIHDGFSAGFSTLREKKVCPNIILLGLSDLKLENLGDNHRFSGSSCVLKLNCIKYRGCSFSCMKRLRRLCFPSLYFVLSVAQGKETYLLQIFFQSVISYKSLRLELIQHFM